ncbi:protein TolA [Francisella philomiragia]|uniref:Group A colicin translocation TolA protein n=1 Tax=Francisella philomiragia subsp. philomiragia (strain ATCC 25017 / CCUG 19701 / FSC 153 / O\|nr:hypothetical protein [Francisella philomiragia]AJI47692.1 putative group A colicin translocation, tolA protein [Francisella philomiragia]AJI48553.1 putative tolA protein [Francisella philomiragia]MBK2021025.1 protein TolA [Francisella philomiragia]MBK2030270.1 protein TolA [Francisella philomiragia]MBK2264524.1 protein TolA [Francisella philomiragia]
MANLNYQKIIRFCKKTVDENPFLVKAILVHIGIVILLYTLAFISDLKFETSQAALSAQVQKAPKQLQIIQATSISSSELDKQISAYENHQQELKQAREDIKQAKKQALIKHQQKLKEQAEAEKRAKLEAKRKAILEAKKKAQEEAKRKKQQELKAKQEAEEKARQERLAKAKAEAIASAKREAEKNQATRALSRYFVEYTDRVGANWIRDNCRGIYSFPKVVTKDGKFIRLDGSTGNPACDQSLIEAVENTTPPEITNSVAKQRIQNENLSIEFKPE